MPTLRSFAMDKNELQVAEFLRLGHPLPFSYCISYCNRSAELDAEGHHVSFGGGPVWEHNLVSEWCQCFRDLQPHHKKEQRNQYVNSKDRPDIIIYDSGVGANVDLDFSLAHPFSKDYTNI